MISQDSSKQLDLNDYSSEDDESAFVDAEDVKLIVAEKPAADK